MLLIAQKTIFLMMTKRKYFEKKLINSKITGHLKMSPQACKILLRVQLAHTAILEALSMSFLVTALRR